MNLNKVQFYRDFSSCICGSLRGEKALWQAYLCLRKFIPIDELLIAIYDLAEGTAEVIATATAGGGKACSVKTVLPPQVLKEMVEANHGLRVRLAKDALQDPITEPIAESLGWPDSSVLTARLIIEGETMGALYARADGRDRFTAEHQALLGQINEPTAMALASWQRQRELEELKENIDNEARYFKNASRPKLPGESISAVFGLREVMHKVRQVAPLHSPVLLLGETGTGKEVIANAIHYLSPRNNGPLIKVNCGGIPETLMDSELFGHEKGAFTNALAQRRGRFERAHGGTIFLDEVAELPPQAQVRLLRVLQEKEIERVGGSKPIRVDIRVISATNRDLASLVAEGRFRDDLYFRLNVFPIHIPPLRERRGEIPALVQHIIQKTSLEMGLTRPPLLAPTALDHLLAYPWPGNVRELENAVERAIIMSRGEPLCFDKVVAAHHQASPPADDYPDARDLRLELVEARHIQRVLALAKGRVEGKGGAAELLGLNPGTLRHRMRKLGIAFGRKGKDA